VNLWVITRTGGPRVIGDGLEFVAPPGGERSYSADLRRAWVFATETQARTNATGDETVRKLVDVLYSPVQERW
jgi:hypothetical protein